MTRRVSRRRAQRRRLLLSGVAVLGAAIVALVAGSVAQALSAKRLLEQAEPLIASARAAAERIDLIEAERSLREALRLVQRAEAKADGAWLRGAAAVPWAGRSAQAIESITDAAEAAVRAGLKATSAAGVFTLENGRPSVGFRGGRIDVGAWARARPALESARALAGTAAAHVRRAPRNLVLPPVAQALSRLTAETARLRTATEHAASLSALIPDLAGGAGPRRYLMVFQNLAEARGTGGLLGGVGIVEARDGRMDLVRTHPDNDLRKLTQPALDMPAWFAERYDPHQARTLWSNVGMEPDFPTSAPLIAAYYAKVFNERVDGVIAIDPYALERMLEATGPVPGPAGVTFEAGTVARFIMSDSYARYPGDQRKAIVLQAAHLVFERLKQGVQPEALAQAMSRAVREKHVLLWMRAASSQSAIAALGAQGGFGSTLTRPTIGVVTQNAGANKIDYYLRRSLRLDLRLNGDGTARGELRVRLENLAPSSGLPRDVLGPPNRAENDPRTDPRYTPGENVTYLNVYLPPEALDVAWSVDGKAASSEQALAPHAFITSRFVRIPSRSSEEVLVRFRLPSDLSARWHDRTLRLSLARQATVSADQLEVRVTAPEGHRLHPGGGRRHNLKTAANANISVDLVVRRPLWARIADAF